MISIFMGGFIIFCLVIMWATWEMSKENKI